MKAIAFITEFSSSETTQWQLDKVMAAIAYDLDISIVFMHDGLSQLENNKAWCALEMYGVENIYYLNFTDKLIKPLFKVKQITTITLKKLTSLAELIL